MSDVEFHNPEAPVEHRLMDVVYSSTTSKAWVVSLAAAEVHGVSHVELRLARSGVDDVVVLTCWEGTVEQAGALEAWGASLQQVPELIASVIRLVTAD